MHGLDLTVHRKRIGRFPFVDVRVPVVVLAMLGSLLAGTEVVHTQSSAPRGSAPRTPATVVVIPFANISRQPDDDWIGAGIAETATADLGQFSELSLIGREAVLDSVSVDRSHALLLGDEAVARDVARELGASWLVMGGFQRLADQLRITARIVSVESGTTFETARIDGSLNDVFSMQDRIVADLAEGFARIGRDETVATGVASRPPLPLRPEPGETEGALDGAPSPSTLSTATITRDPDGRTTVRAVRLQEPLNIDGTLDEAVYELVPSVGDFIQQQPDEGAPATERTEAWVFYDDSNVYFSGRMWDSAPESEWIVNAMQRDSRQLIQNEGFSVTLDTFYDRRNGVTFRVNPIGGFMDRQITDEGQPNADWNTIWSVRTGRFDGGWTAEMAIPFKSLRFPPGESQVWGLQLGRRIRRKNEATYLTPVPISGGPGVFRVSAAATLTGVQVPRGNRTFEIKPYAIGSVASDVNAVPAIANEGDGDFGVDVKYGVTQNLTADFTYNTDFAQVEVDEQQVNLTRFSLFFPEKREFFLEGSGIFDFGQEASFGGGGGGGGGGRPGSSSFFGAGDAPIVFFSRRIGLEEGQTVPILGGGRLTGKVGDFTVGALNIQTDDAFDGGAVSTNFSVIRVKRDILRRSRVGGIFTGRSKRPAAADQGRTGSNQVYGLDAAFVFYDNVNFTSFYARSQTPGISENDASYQAALTYNGDLYAFQVDHLLVGDNFNPEVGFVRRDDIRRTFATAQYSPRPALRAVRQFTWGASLDYIEQDTTGLLETRLAQARFQTEFENSDRFGADVQDSHEFLVTPFDIAPGDGISIPVGAYDFQDIFTSYTFGPQRRLSGSATFQRGEFFDGDITAVGYRRGRVEVTPQFSVEPSVSVNRITLPAGRFTTTLVQSRVVYTLTPRMFFGGLLQYNSTADSLSTNLRLRWEYQPGSELFVVYNDVRDTELRGTPMLENRAFIVKLTRLFRF